MRRHRTSLPLEALAQLRLPRDVRLSADGRRVVYAEARLDLQRNRTLHTLVAVDVSTGKARALTPGTHDDRDPCWAPEARTLVFVSDRDGGPNLWRLDLASGVSERLTHLRGDVCQPRVSPDGTHVAFLHAPAAGPSAARSGASPAVPPFRTRRGSDTSPDDPGSQLAPWVRLWVLDLRTRRLRRLTRGAAHAAEPAWSPDSRALVYVSHRMPHGMLHRQDADLCVVARRGGTERVLTRQRGAKFAPAWSPGGTAVAYIGRTASEAAATLRMWTVSARGGQPHDLLGDADLACAHVCVGDDGADTTVHSPAWSPSGTRLFFLGSEQGAVNVYEVLARGGTPRPRTSGRHAITAFSCSRNGRVWALGRTDPVSPGELFVARFGATHRPRHAAVAVRGAAVQQLTRLNATALRGTALVRPHEFRLKSPQGHSVHGFVLRARGARRAPAVLVLHADPGTMVGWSFAFEFQALAAAGMHVFLPNLRGSAGYGRDFERALVGRWGFEDWNDLNSVADWAASRPFVDPQRLAVVGRGHGGFLAHWALGHSRRFRCAVTTAGPVDFVSLFGTSAAGRLLAAEFLAPPWETHERYWRTSPLAFADHMRAPLLLLSGDDDRHCPPAQAEELFAALALRQRDVEWVSFAGAAHDFDRSGQPHTRRERLRRLLDWLQRKL